MQAKIRELIHTLLPRVADEVAATLMNSIRILTEPVDESKLPLGASKLGGSPDLPPGAAWPEWNEGPLAFIAQFRMPDVTEYDAEGVLPRPGMLYFFYEDSEQPWGYDPVDRGSWRVLYAEVEPLLLIRTAAPPDLPEDSSFNACALTFSREPTLREWYPVADLEQLGNEIAHTEEEKEKYNQLKEWIESLELTPTYPAEIERLDLTKEEMEAYGKLVDKLKELRIEDIRDIHQMLGYPAEVQGSMELDCQLVYHGINCGGPEAYKDPRVATLAAGASDWRLLLQVDSDDNAGMMWGDAGRIYFWIRRQDLEARNFDDVWLKLQCY